LFSSIFKFGLPLVWQTKLHTYTKRQAKLWFCVFREETEGQESEDNGTKHFQNLICS
jgi:hypothetical protein